MTKIDPKSNSIPILVMVVTGFISIVLIRNVFILANTSVPTQEIEQEISVLKEEVEYLEQSQQSEMNDFQRELAIRNELNMKKEGDIILQLPPDTEVKKPPLPTATPTPPIYKQWAEILF